MIRDKTLKEILQFIENYSSRALFIWSSSLAKNDFILLLDDGKGIEYIRIFVVFNSASISICGTKSEWINHLDKEQYNAIIRKLEDYNGKTIEELSDGNVSYL